MLLAERCARLQHCITESAASVRTRGRQGAGCPCAGQGCRTRRPGARPPAPPSPPLKAGPAHANTSHTAQKALVMLLLSIPPVASQGGEQAILPCQRGQVPHAVGLVDNAKLDSSPDDVDPSREFLSKPVEQQAAAAGPICCSKLRTSSNQTEQRLVCSPPGRCRGAAARTRGSAHAPGSRCPGCQGAPCWAVTLLLPAS